MRLVVRHVKVPDAEREIDRIEIFERGGEEPQMRGEEQRSKDEDRCVGIMQNAEC